MTMDERRDRIKGAMYGVAVGDALGAPLEFISKETIRRMHGTVKDMIGGGWLKVLPGEITDDTQMTIAVAKGIVEQPDDPIPAIGRRFVEWYASQPKDIGTTCSASITNAMRIAGDKTCPTANDWLEASTMTDRATGGKSAGNGSLMRTAYVGLYYAKEGDVCDFAQAISRMTHFDPVAAQDCQAYSLMLFRMVSEDSITKRREMIPHILRAIKPCGERYDIGALSSGAYQPNPTGYVVDRFAAALHCVFTTHAFEDAVVKAVNLGGDADTIGAITGGLAGALYGLGGIPHRWSTALDEKVCAELDALCDAATEKRIGAHTDA